MSLRPQIRRICKEKWQLFLPVSGRTVHFYTFQAALGYLRGDDAPYGMNLAFSVLAKGHNEDLQDMIGSLQPCQKK